MNQLTNQNHLALEQRLSNIALPIQCYWAKYFPIIVTTAEDVGIAGMNFKQVFADPRLGKFDDDVLFCVLAHEWAHRMVSPKSIATSQRIVSAVAESLSIDLQLARMASEPAIELIVDQTNCEIEQWGTCYKNGFTNIFACFIDELEAESHHAARVDSDFLDFRKLMLALRLANISTSPLPAYVRRTEKEARYLIDLLFQNRVDYADENDPDHLKKIIRFAAAFYERILKKILKHPHDCPHFLVFLDEIGDLISTLASSASIAGITTGAGAIATKKRNTDQNKSLFDLRLSRQVTDYLLHQAHKPRQLTGLWQPGHPINKLDMKRSFRSSIQLIPGITTRRKTDSTRILHFAGGRKLRLCLVVDDSGSMCGEEARFSRSLCEGINDFAVRKDIHIGLITFGEQIGTAFLPERNYQKLRQVLMGLDGNLGGTNLLPALVQLAHHIELDREITHALLITDAGFSDWEKSLQQFTAITAQINITVLMINCDVPEHFQKEVSNLGHVVHIFQVNPALPANMTILEGIIR